MATLLLPPLPCPGKGVLLAGMGPALHYSLTAALAAPMLLLAVLHRPGRDVISPV